jgi:hypothetical protein
MSSDIKTSKARVISQIRYTSTGVLISPYDNVPNNGHVSNENEFGHQNIESKSDFSGSMHKYRGADRSLARPGRKKATATEDFDFHLFYL